jgi:hypothetical protein
MAIHLDEARKKEIHGLLNVYLRLHEVLVKLNWRKFSVTKMLRCVNIIPSLFLLAFIYLPSELLIFRYYLSILEVFHKFFKFSMTVNVFGDSDMTIPSWLLEWSTVIIDYTSNLLKVFKN